MHYFWPEQRGCQQEWRCSCVLCGVRVCMAVIWNRYLMGWPARTGAQHHRQRCRFAFVALSSPVCHRPFCVRRLFWTLHNLWRKGKRCDDVIWDNAHIHARIASYTLTPRERERTPKTGKMRRDASEECAKTSTAANRFCDALVYIKKIVLKGFAVSRSVYGKCANRGVIHELN